jgi:hypothetical protein
MLTLPEKSLFVGNERENEMNKLLFGELVGLSDEALIETLAGEFQIEKSVFDSVEILIGKMDQDGYDGSAYFLIRNRVTGDLYEVTGGHCSCYGFEGQWEPAITSKAYLLSENYPYRSDEAIKQFVTELFS